MTMSATKATSSVSDILPLATPRFQGRVGNTYIDSEAEIIALPTAPAGAPNVLLVVLDDVGFGQTSTFGGPANTPTLQRLADQGLRFNRFHTTALCSPTRAALLISASTRPSTSAATRSHRFLICTSHRSLLPARFFA
jgi:arylsulfatase